MIFTQALIILRRGAAGFFLIRGYFCSAEGEGIGHESEFLVLKSTSTPRPSESRLLKLNSQNAPYKCDWELS